jgi:hypothetical protein
MGERKREGAGTRRIRGAALLGKGIYWLAVLAVSVAILVALILFLESRDSSSVNGVVALF